MLFDSYPHITAAFEKMMADYGESIDKAETQKMFEINFATVFNHFGTTDLQKAQFKEYEHDNLLEPIAVPFENTCRTLKAIFDSGNKNFLYTHRGNSVYYYLKEYKLYDYFTDFVTSHDGFPSKPAPDAILHLIKKHNLNPAETLMSGDREIDVMAGKNAGVYGCLFSKSERETKADFLVDDIIKIIDLG